MSSSARCRNCQTPLNGEFCSHCGQRDVGADLSFRQVAGELADELFDWDSRLWRTLLPLLFRPGYLTAEYLAGRRARYVSPLRLYLIISFLMFLVFSLGVSDELVLQVDHHGQSTPAAQSGELVIAPIVIGEPTDAGAATGMGIGLADEDSPRWLRDLDARIEANADVFSRNPDMFPQLVEEYLPQMMFVLLPVFALLLQLCYLFSPFHYLQHLVFSLHYHSFAYLLYLFGALVSSFLYEPGIAGVLFLLFALYLPVALVRVYGSGIAGAIGRSLFILLVDAILLLLAFVVLILAILART